MIIYVIIGRDYEDSYVEKEVFISRSSAEFKVKELIKEQSELLKGAKGFVTVYEYEIIDCELAND